MNFEFEVRIIIVVIIIIIILVSIVSLLLRLPNRLVSQGFVSSTILGIRRAHNFVI